MNRIVPGWAVTLTLSASLAAQCQLAGATEFAYPGAAGDVLAMTRWDPDGSGPEVERLVIAGNFGIAGILANRVASYEPATGLWRDLGIGLSPTATVNALVVVPSPTTPGRFDLIAGGALNPGSVARWNGINWSTIGTGVGGAVYALAWDGTTLFAGGTFPTAGSAVMSATNLIAGPWSPVGNLVGTTTYALRIVGNELIAGGLNFTAPVTGSIARWNPTSGWRPIGAGLNGQVYALTARGSTVIAGGLFTASGSTILAFLGQCDLAAPTLTWSAPTSPPPSGIVRSLELDGAGNLVVGSELPTNPATRASIGVWNWATSSWTAVGTGAANGAVLALATFGDVYVGGSFTTIDGFSAPQIARRSATAWSTLSTGLTAGANCVGIMPNGHMVVSSSNQVLERSGTSWLPLANTSPSGVKILTSYRGELIAAGDFPSQWPSGILRNVSGSWLTLGTGLPVGSLVDAVLVDTNGDLIVAGQIPAAGSNGANILRWTGSNWAPFATTPNNGGLNGRVRTLVRHQGKVVAGGDFLTATANPALLLSRLAAWTPGSGWTQLGTPAPGIISGQVSSVAELPDGGLLVGGSFTPAAGSTVNHIVEITAAGQWQALTTGGISGTNGSKVDRIIIAPNGDALVFGDFTTAGNINANRIARWDGNSWSPLGSGLIPSPATSALMTTDGDLYVAGSFGTAFDAFANAGILRPTCRASSSSYGSACLGSSGTLDLTASTLPWIGGTMQLACSGFGGSSLGISIVGSATAAIPLQQVHPAGSPACLLSNNGDIETKIVFPTAGIATSSIAIPPSAALVGLVGYAQMAEVALAPNLSITSIASSNGLALTVGSF